MANFMFYARGPCNCFFKVFPIKNSMLKYDL